LLHGRSVAALRPIGRGAGALSSRHGPRRRTDGCLDFACGGHRDPAALRRHRAAGSSDAVL